MNVIALAIYLFLNAPVILFMIQNKDNRKIGKRATILEYIAKIANLVNIFTITFLARFSSSVAYYSWIGICFILLFIYYAIYMRYFMNNNMRIIYGINKINLPTVLIEIAIPIASGLLTLHPILIVSSFIYGVIHYHLESEIQKRVRFR